MTDDSLTQTQFFMMMYGGLFLTVLVFCIVAFFIVTRKNFKVHGVDAGSVDSTEAAETTVPLAEVPASDDEQVTTGPSTTNNS